MAGAEVEQYRDQERPVAMAPVTLTERDLAMIERVAKVLSTSAAAGGYRGKPDDLVLAGIQAHHLGLALPTAITDLFPIPSQGGSTRITLSARLRVALCFRAGHAFGFCNETAPNQRCGCGAEHPQSLCDSTKARAWLRRRGNRHVHTLTYTLEEAKAADLYPKKDNWKNHPAAMLRAAAARNLVTAAAPEIILGLPALSLEDFDEQIDETVDVVDHTVAAGASPAPGILDVTPEAEDVPLTDAERDTLIARLGQLTAEQRAYVVEEAQAQVLPNLKNGAGHRNPFRVSHRAILETIIGEALTAFPACDGDDGPAFGEEAAEAEPAPSDEIPDDPFE